MTWIQISNFKWYSLPLRLFVFFACLVGRKLPLITVGHERVIHVSVAIIPVIDPKVFCFTLVDFLENRLQPANQFGVFFCF